MRAHGSIMSQLLVTFCVCAVLIGAAAVAGYITVTDQTAATRRITEQYAGLQRVNSDRETAFGTATFAVLFYAETGQRGFLAQLTGARARFDGDLATLRRGATPGLRALIGVQSRLGAQCFALAPGAGRSAPAPGRRRPC